MRKLFLLLLWPTLACAQLYSGVVANSRTENIGNGWQDHAGLPGTFADGETTPNAWTPPTRSIVCATISSGATVATINTAIAGCAPGQVVQLPCDKTITNVAATKLNLTKSYVTLRGCSDQTTIFMPGAGQVSTQSASLGQPTCSWTGGFAQGTTVLTASCTPAVGTVLWLSANGVLSDTGDVLTCVNTGICSDQGGTNAVYQTVIVTAAAAGSITISPGLYSNMGAPLTSPLITQLTNEAIGVGLEDMTIDCSGNTNNDCVFFGYTHYSWMKGVRLINAKVGQEQAQLRDTFRCLMANNYFYTLVTPSSNTEELVINTASDDLVINNIFTAGFGVYVQGPSQGEVFLYNLLRDGSGSSIPGGPYLNNIIVDHTATRFELLEGNQMGGFQDDFIHGTQNFQTLFRNTMFGQDPPYTVVNHITPVSLEGYSRFENIVGNVLGSSSQTKYKSTPSNTGGSPSIELGTFDGLTSSPHPSDPQAPSMAFLWGNYDVQTAAVRWCGNSGNTGWSTTCASTSEVPSGLLATIGFTQNLGTGNGATTTFSGTLSNTPLTTGNLIVIAGGVIGYDNLAGGISGPGISSGSITYSSGAVSVTFSSAPANGVAVTVNYLQQTASASPYQNPVPASQTLPASFFLPTTAHPAGGTGLSWWKVCTNYPACSSFTTQPFPTSGPDVTGGNLTAGFAYDIPASIAWKTLPVDPTYQSSFSVTGSSWAAGKQTLNVVISGSFFPMGEFQVTGMSPSGCNGTFQITGSSATSITYTAPVNLGCGTTGTVLYPDVRVFNESVYTTDSASFAQATFTPPSLTFNNVPVGLTSNPQSVTLQNTGTANLVNTSIQMNNSKFSLINNTCGSPATITLGTPGTGFTLTPGATCTFQVVYTPPAVNNDVGGAIFFENTTGGNDQIGFSGIGNGPSAPSVTIFAILREKRAAPGQNLAHLPVGHWRTPVALLSQPLWRNE